MNKFSKLLASALLAGTAFPLLLLMSKLPLYLSNARMMKLR